MDHHELLLILTTNDKQENQSFDENLEQLITKITYMMPEENRDEVTRMKITPNCMVRCRYLQLILYVLKSLKNSELSKSDTFMSVKQHKTVKSAMEIVTSIGILPCLFPGIGTGIYVTCLQVDTKDNEKLTDLQKYDRLSLTVRYLTDFFDEIAFRSALLSQLGPLLAGLLQLSYAPLVKPITSLVDERSEVASSTDFKMTKEMHEKLMKDQNEFRESLSSLIVKCPKTIIVKEFMIILGMKKLPKWIRRRTQIYLVDAMVQPNGILALVDAVCGDNIDVGAHWNKLDTVARLVATSQGQDPDQYYDAVCSQLVELLKSKNIKNSSVMATSCIRALYDHDPDVCVKKVVRIIATPLRRESNLTKILSRTETEVEDCIENLTKCFVSKDAKFKYLPCSLLREIAIPLFCLYKKSRGSVSSLQTKIRDLLIHLMKDSNSRDDLFSVFLDRPSKSQNYFGEKLSCKFGPTGGLEITSETEDLDHETIADGLFDLVSNDQTLGSDLFDYLLRSLVNSDDKTIQVLENIDDTVDRIERKLATMKLLSNLASMRKIQEAQIKNPQRIVSFVKSLFDERMKKQINKESGNEEEEENIQVLYVGLMLINVILTDNEKPKDWTLFDELAKFLMKVNEQAKIPQQLSILVEEILDIVKSRGKSATRRYWDLNVDERKGESDFEKALKDLADPMLPVRVHGLITLTKLLEKKDPETVAKKDIVLCFFRENLKDDDSFVYLSAVNGLCAFATIFPDKVIETLIQEYIDMPQRNTNGEISPEIRAKLGEILVRTTRSLGEMCTVYKNTLINGFLSGTRDSDDMVRASSLSCLGEICKVMGFRLGHAINEIIYCIGCIISTDKSPECRRAAVLVATLLIHGLGKDVLTDLGSDLVPLYRALKFLRDNDDDQVLRLHAQLALEELDDIVQALLFTMPKLEKRLFLLP